MPVFTRPLSCSFIGLLVAGLSLAMLASTGPVASAFASPLASIEPTLAAQGSGPLEASDEASAALTASLRDKPVEVLSARTETKTLWANPDGTFTAETATAPIRVRDGEAWMPVDLSLESVGAILEPKDSPADVAFFKGGNGRLAKLDFGPTTSLELGWKSTLPAPDVDGGLATYELNPNLDVQLAATSSGFETNVLVKAKPAASPVWRMPLKFKNMTATPDDGGGLALTDARGQVRARIDAPLMWDSRTNEAGDPAITRPVAMRLDTVNGVQELVLTPDPAFFTDPATQYPVTVDPSLTPINPTRDTYVNNNTTVSRSSAFNLPVGTPNGGKDINRSLLHFPNPVIAANQRVTAADLRLWNYYSGTCTALQNVRASAITSSWDNSTTWVDRPSITASNHPTVTNTSFTNGGSGPNCNPAGWASINLKDMVGWWMDRTNNFDNIGVQLTSDEALTSAYKVFCSRDIVAGSSCNNAAWVPTLRVTYNTIPRPALGRGISPCGGGCEGSIKYTNSNRPTITASSRDAETTQKLRFDFEVWDGHSDTPTTRLLTGSVPGISSGGVASWQVPSNLTGDKEYRVRAFDGQHYGDWSPGYFKFSIDTTAPPTPSVSSTEYPSGNAWSGASGQAGNFTFTTSASDHYAYTYQLDEGQPIAVAATGGKSVDIVATGGSHVLHVVSADKAGNTNQTDYLYNVNPGALVSPRHGDQISVGSVALEAIARPGLTGATFEYRRGPGDQPHIIPAQDVTVVATGNALSWPMSVTSAAGSSRAEGIRWDMLATLGDDGLVEVRAVFQGTPNATTDWVSVTLNRRAAAVTTERIGPGTVNLVDGNTMVTAREGGHHNLVLERTAQSRSPQAGGSLVGLVAPFGPEWTVSGIDPTAGSAYRAVETQGTLNVRLVRHDGSVAHFVRQSGAGADTVWKPEVGSEQLVLTGDGQADSPFLLGDEDARLVEFQSGSGPNYPISYVTNKSSAGLGTGFRYEPDNEGSQRLARLIAPTSAVASPGLCNSAVPPVGCRVLELVYTPSSTPAPTGTSLGDYPRRVSTLRLYAATPGPNPNQAQMTSEDIARYRYDKDGRLIEVYDPRAASLVTRYAYDNAGRVISVTNPGVQPWILTYGSVGSDGNGGRLLKASQGGQLQKSLVYNVPLTPGSGGPADLSEGTISAWGQVGRMSPVAATAVFPGDVIPQVHSQNPGVPWVRASVSYLDSAGRRTNTVQPGGALDWVRYDEFGNVVTALTAKNRSLASRSSTDAELQFLGLSSLSVAGRADMLSTHLTYEQDGTRQVSVKGPVTVKSVSGQLLPARQLVRTIYDEGRPADAPVQGLPTTTRVSALLADGSDRDPQVTKLAYDWDLGLQTKESRTLEDGTVVVRETVYDDDGRPIKSVQPMSNGADAGTYRTLYYSGESRSDGCGSRPEWSDFVCKTLPAANITTPTGGSLQGSSPTLPTSTYSYSRLGDVTKVVETGIDAGGLAKSRTVEVTFDAAGRPVRSTITGGGQSLPAIDTSYDASNGKPNIVSSTTGSVTTTVVTTFDSFGRVAQYKDAGGATTEFGYDELGRVTNKTYSNGSSATFGYGSPSDPRDLPTRITDSIAGEVVASYDEDGNLSTQTVSPRLSTAKYQVENRYDSTDSTTSRTWTRTQNGVTDLISDESVESDVLGQWITYQGRDSEKKYGYDGLGRLITVQSSNVGGCRATRYVFDANSNRINDDSTSTSTPECPNIPAKPAVAEYKYDTGDRLLGSGYTYDEFGRARNLSDGTSLNYYSNDAIQSVATSSAQTSSGLDPLARVWQSATVSSGVTTGNIYHYSDDSDAPSWIAEGQGEEGPITRYVPGLDGAPIMTTSRQGDVQLLLNDLHGDTVMSVDVSGTSSNPDHAYSFDEYGNSEGTPRARYGWLGAWQRLAEYPADLVLIGSRLYDPKMGRFTTLDPVPSGTANAYGYTPDPVNTVDVTGQGVTGREFRACMLFGTLVCADATYLSRTILNRTKSGFINRRKGDSVRHFSWQATLAFTWGAWYAERLGNAHEYYGLRSDDWRVRNAARVDMENNAIGRAWADKYNNFLFSFLLRRGRNDLIELIITNGAWEYDNHRLARDLCINPGRGRYQICRR